MSETERDTTPRADDESAGGLLPDDADVLEGNVEVGGDPFAGTQGGQTARRLAEQED